MEYYKYEQYEIMIPKIFGVEVKKDISVSSASGARKKWDEKSFFEDATAKLDAVGMATVKKLYEFSKNNSDGISWGTGSANGSSSPKFSKISNTKSLYTIRSNGRLSLNFGWLNENDSAAGYRDKFKELLEKEKLFSIPEDYREHYPEYKIEEWVAKTEEFIGVVKALLK